MQRKWTEWEVQYLERFYLRQPIKKTAEKLGRTVNSVERKAARLKLNHCKTEFCTKAILMNCFNVDCRVINRWITKYHLPYKKIAHGNTMTCGVKIDDFWIWAKKHKDIINWSRYERNSLPPDPEWVRDAVLNCSITNKSKKYTEQEIINIKHMLRRGLTYKEIAKETGRSYYGIMSLCQSIWM